MKVHILTLGCSKNTVDSETLAGHLKANSLELAADVDDADTLVINTCGFIDQAKEESVNAILEAAKLRSSGKLKQLVVAGCLSERYGDDLRREIPEVDHFFGTEAYEKIIKAISPDLKYTLLGERILTSPVPYAYLKISEGCDHPCSFCAIPVMRGTHRSIDPDTLLTSARSLVAQGAKELVLVAQDLTYYGMDIDGKRSLATLLERLAGESGAEWIRCMYAYPSHFPKDVLTVIRDTPNICTYLDMPLQHASTQVLKNMRRGITRRTTEELLDEIRQTVPDIVLRSTFIVGYPSETEADVDELEEFITQQRFQRLGVFTYSQEDDTYAYILGDPIPTEVKEQRRARIMEAQRQISYDANQMRIGKTLRVLIEEEVSGEWRGRSEADAPEVDNEVYVRSDVPLAVGDFVTVEIEDAAEFDLFGTALGQ
ncbi:MAG: 30S ribosomal protein S12 methylthiotransferase RimO [Candidatus Kapabacteria bacterium]|nr:30S ribosomal protein S12 methylthiotransferase RimO [Candidatus Kapabacteria bacterium]